MWFCACFQDLNVQEVICNFVLLPYYNACIVIKVNLLNHNKNYVRINFNFYQILVNLLSLPLESYKKL